MSEIVWMVTKQDDGSLRVEGPRDPSGVVKRMNAALEVHGYRLHRDATRAWHIESPKEDFFWLPPMEFDEAGWPTGDRYGSY